MMPFYNNSPVIIGFAALSLCALVLNTITGGIANKLCFSTYRSSLLSPLTYVRMFGHVLGHQNFSHFWGNMMFILLLGPMLEEKYGSAQLLVMVAVTAVVTAVANAIIFSDMASGIAFMFVVLASMVSLRAGAIPLTTVLVIGAFIWQQVVSLFQKDNVSHFTHILGGACGAVLGWLAFLRPLI